jgi:hypothetical protein
VDAGVEPLLLFLDFPLDEEAIEADLILAVKETFLHLRFRREILRSRSE